MKNLTNLDSFKKGDIVSGRHADGDIYCDAYVKEDDVGFLYILFGRERKYLFDFYNLTKRS